MKKAVSKPLTDCSHKEHDHAHDHSHSHGGLFGAYSEIGFSVLCGLLLGGAYTLSFYLSSSLLIQGLYLAAYFFGGYYALMEAIEKLRKKQFEIDFLMLVAAIGAAALGEWAEGALLLFLFSLGHALEHYAMNKAKRSVAALAALAPKTILVKREGKEIEIALDQMEVGDIALIKPHQQIGADGVILNGQSEVNQAAITGESMPVEKMPLPQLTGNSVGGKETEDRYQVYAGTLNGGGSLTIQVSKKASESTLARLVKMVSDTQTKQSPTQQFTKKLQRIYVPAVLSLVTLLLFAFVVLDETFSESFYRAMSVLVAASPCALAISTPSAVLSAMARAAKSGVLIKGGGPLEKLGKVQALAFDKTGTLTQGTPQVTEMKTFGGVEENKLLRFIVALEKQSDHPLAKALLNYAGTETVNNTPLANSLQVVIGKGISGELDGEKIRIGNAALFEQLPAAVQQHVDRLYEEGKSMMLVEASGEIVGLVALMDLPRPEALTVIRQLKEMGIRETVMLTGDHQAVAAAVAGQLALDSFKGALLPEQKVESVSALKKTYGEVAMVGDGVNDAPAMAASSVGIAMGAAGSDVALEAADVALMANQLHQLPFAIGLSRKSARIIRQNLWLSLGMVALLVPLTLFGVSGIGWAVIGHEGSTVVVVFNALRLLTYRQGEQPIS